MKKNILLLFAAFATLAASAQTKVEIDGIWYNLISKAKQAEVTYRGSSYNSYSNEYTGVVTIPATVTHNGVEYSVTSIGGSAFRDCSSLTAITLPESVTSIGSSAFSGCSSLTAITIPEGVTSIEFQAFWGCSSLTAITIPEGVTSIGLQAFWGCSSLTAINIPEGVTSIGQSAFSGCRKLTAINIPENSQLTSIGYEAFEGCSGLTSISIPEGVTSIGEYAFSSCNSLTTIVLPKSVGYISSKAFAGCPELTDVYCYAETVPSTYSNAFDGSYPEYATLHVPASAINSYMATAPWSSFGTIKTIENVTLEKCATPTISYVDGEVVFTCETEEVTFISETTENIAGNRNDAKFAVIPTYTLTAYATKENYEDSDPVSLTLCWIPCSEAHESEETSILTIPSKPVLISARDGVLTLSGLAEGTAVAAYNTAGTPLATATATDGTATLATGLDAGNIAIVKMGDYSIRIAIK